MATVQSVIREIRRSIRKKFVGQLAAIDRLARSGGDRKKFAKLDSAVRDARGIAKNKLKATDDFLKGRLRRQCSRKPAMRAAKKIKGGQRVAK